MAFGAIVVAVVVVRVAVLDVLTVASDSMSPTVCVGDMVLLLRLHGTGVGPGDVVTFHDADTGDEVIKRVAAVGGQRVAIQDAVLTVDGVAVPEPWVDRRTIDGLYFGPVTVPPDSVFLLGDHREVSIDSRTFGPIATGRLDARLLAVLGSACS
ncbi:signal peptidase I [Nakamurella flava]|uniref:signal peptidase I n=1 Tax=Nakamurella flava TaxID=2576308 RepID=UPI00140E5686|nr:signal peptidase I [Nakamurella flava]